MKEHHDLDTTQIKNIMSLRLNKDSSTDKHLSPIINSSFTITAGAKVSD
jgi:hypothetical protein